MSGLRAPGTTCSARAATAAASKPWPVAPRSRPDFARRGSRRARPGMSSAMSGPGNRRPSPWSGRPGVMSVMSSLRWSASSIPVSSSSEANSPCRRASAGRRPRARLQPLAAAGHRRSPDPCLAAGRAGRCHRCGGPGHQRDPDAGCGRPLAGLTRPGARGARQRRPAATGKPGRHRLGTVRGPGAPTSGWRRPSRSTFVPGAVPAVPGAVPASATSTHFPECGFTSSATRSPGCGRGGDEGARAAPMRPAAAGRQASARGWSGAPAWSRLRKCRGAEWGWPQERAYAVVRGCIRAKALSGVRRGARSRWTTVPVAGPFGWGILRPGDRVAGLSVRRGGAAGRLRLAECSVRLRTQDPAASPVVAVHGWLGSGPVGVRSRTAVTHPSGTQVS